MKKIFIAITLSIVVFNIFSQEFSEIPDLKICIIIPKGSQYASTLYASGYKEVLDVTTKLINEINAYMELGSWITVKSYYMGIPIDIYGNEEYVKKLVEFFNASEY